MIVLSEQDVESLMEYRALIEALRAAFRAQITTPVRHHHTISMPDQADATLLLMPAWHDAVAKGTSNETYLGIKMVTVYPDNEARQSLPSILGTYILLDGQSGAIKALLDGPALTVWRTACASALAADYLARKDAARLVMVGTGAMSPHLIRAHCAIRPITRVSVWGRNPDKARALAETCAELGDLGIAVEAAGDLEAVVKEADIVSCATMSSEPLVKGAWLKQGAHLDLVGAYRPDMRESDDEAVRRANVFVDTLGGATKEGGDIVQPLASGVLNPDDIHGDLFGLARDKCQGRESEKAITLFKSVGTAIEDLAAAQFVYERHIA